MLVCLIFSLLQPPLIVCRKRKTLGFACTLGSPTLLCQWLKHILWYCNDAVSPASDNQSSSANKPTLYHPYSAKRCVVVSTTTLKIRQYMYMYQSLFSGFGCGPCVCARISQRLSFMHGAHIPKKMSHALVHMTLRNIRKCNWFLTFIFTYPKALLPCELP